VVLLQRHLILLLLRLCVRLLPLLPTSPSTALPRLRGCLGSAAGSKAAAALASLESICALATSLGLAAASLRIQPLLPPSEAYISGMHFELHVPSAPRAEGAPSRAVAAGGRYDALFEASWPLAQEGAAPTAVGISFSVSRLAQLALPAAASAATDVLVAARGGGGLLAERLALTAALWQAGVRAETLPQPAPRVAELRGRFGLPVWRGVGVSVAGDLPYHTDGADALLIEAKPPKNATRPGGNAVTFDWDILAGWRPGFDWLLAGGLTLANVAEAVTRSGAPAVDLSSGVESAPGVKDPALIRAFVLAAKRLGA
jgi:hypothetical protein